MSEIREITELLASLALNLKATDPTARNADPSNDLSISTLNQSLNLTEESRVRVLDTALSLMCFTAPQVFDTVIEYFVKTIVTVLSSLVKCKVFRFHKEEVLRIGGTISSEDIVEVIEACADVLGKLEGHGMLSCSLLDAALRVAVSASCFRHVMQLAPILDVKSVDGRSLALTKLLCYLPREISLKSQEIPLRLLFWYFDPLILKHDVSKILQESTKRPFLCLNTELYERVEWRSTVICLAISPSMFIETRNLLHNWFLLTGLASVLELQIELVSLVLDTVSRPMRWGISSEVGLMLPFSPAYFPYEHQLLRILAGPLTCGDFLNLVHSISKSVSQTVTKTATVDHKSMWAMVMNFPDWFYFACVLLFSPRSFRDSFPSTFTLGDVKNQKSLEEGALCSAAARYIAWILDPISKSHQDMLAEYLTKIAGSFTPKQYGSDKHNKAASSYNTKLKKPKVQDDIKGYLKEYDFQIIQLWLKEFQEVYIRYSNSTVNSSSEAKAAQAIRLGQNVFFRRISLGILIGCSDQINEDGCELLLHYTATGTIFQSTNTQSAGLRHKRRNSELQEGFIKWIENCNRKEAEKGACLVFHLTDVTENMLASLCETEESEVDFICRVKSRAGKYLVKCVRRLLQLKVHEDVLMKRDLHNRLVRWRQQGKDVLHGYKDLDEAIDAMSNTLSSM